MSETFAPEQMRNKAAELEDDGIWTEAADMLRYAADALQAQRGACQHPRIIPFLVPSHDKDGPQVRQEGFMCYDCAMRFSHV